MWTGGTRKRKMKDLVLFGYFGRFSKLFVIIISFLILLCFHQAGLQAKPVSDTEAVNVVSGWLKADDEPLGTRLGRDIESVQTFSDANGQELYYVIYLQPDGFVIVPADDMVEPVIAFIEKGITPPQMSILLVPWSAGTYPPGFLVHRSVHIQLKKNVLADGAAAMFG